MMGRKIMVLAGCAALGACGGGGGSDSPNAPDPVATSTPTPSPSPINYQRFAQQTGNRTYATSCAAGITRVPGTVIYPATEFGSGLSIGFNAGTMLYSITGANGVNVNFGPANLEPSPPAGVSAAYSRTLANGFRERFVVGSGGLASGTADYVRSVYVAAQTGAGEPLIQYCVLGVPTLLSDRPANGTYAFGQFAVSGFALEQTTAGVNAYDLKDSIVTLTANTTNGTLAASIRLVGRKVENGVPSGAITELGTFTGSPDFDNTATTFDGALTSANRTNLQSAIGGWFFGPQGVEIGASFTVVAEDSAGSRISALGTVIGKR